MISAKLTYTYNIVVFADTVMHDPDPPSRIAYCSSGHPWTLLLLASPLQNLICAISHWPSIILYGLLPGASYSGQHNMHEQ